MKIITNPDTNFIVEGFKKCAGKGCKNNGTILLKIEYIRKTGYFCNTCAHDLLQSGLARV
jgi:hypothetical protein